MRPGEAGSLIAFGLLLSGCVDNQAPGNDREARLSPPEPPAEVASAGSAIEGVGTGLLTPQTMTEADLRNLPDRGNPCLFRFTRVGLPVLAYGSTAVLKLNDKLVSLGATGSGVAAAAGTDGAEGEPSAGRLYAAEGLSVTVRPVETDVGEGEPFEAELVLRLPDADHERGYRGFSECEGR